jgi:hypothetical protein
MASGERGSSSTKIPSGVLGWQWSCNGTDTTFQFTRQPVDTHQHELSHITSNNVAMKIVVIIGTEDGQRQMFKGVK